MTRLGRAANLRAIAFCSILWSMGFNEKNLGEARTYLASNGALRRAVGALPDALLEPNYLGVGEHNLNFWFHEPASGQKYVLRINVATQPFHDNQVAYEFAALRALEPSGCTPKPIYLDDSPTSPGKGAIVETFCEGSELDFDHLKPNDIDCAVRLMAEVHAVPVSEKCPLFRPKDPARALLEECLERFRLYRSSAFEEPRLTRWVERSIAKAEALLNNTTCCPDGSRRIINTETLPSHFLIPKEDASARDVGAFIDWERPIIGEVAQDIAYFTSPTTTFWDSDWLFPASMVEQVVERYWDAVDGRIPRANFDGRFRLYRALTALRSTTWCCRALVQYSQPETHKTKRTVEKLPMYLSDDFLALLADECF